MAFDDPEKIIEAKRLAAGPLGEKISKFPLLFSKAAFLGERPAKHKSTQVSNNSRTR